MAEIVSASAMRRIEDIVEGELFLAEMRLIRYHARLADWAVGHGKSPADVISGPIFHMTKEELAELKEGLENV